MTEFKPDEQTFLPVMEEEKKSPEIVIKFADPDDGLDEKCSSCGDSKGGCSQCGFGRGK